MTNTLILMSDEHSRKVMGAYGNKQVHTPNLDALAARGTLFDTAYCNSPICVPSRASLHTGQYPHQIGYWDNATPFDGGVKTWGHALRALGKPVVSIGKLHFRNATDDTGFDEQILPLHVKDGIGDPTSLLRRNPPPRTAPRQLAAMTGQGVTPYWDYDQSVAHAAADWIGKQAPDGGWTVFVSLVLPHFPLNAPQRFRDLYDRDTLPLPKMNDSYLPENNAIKRMRGLQNFQDYFQTEDEIREALAHYYALCSALDENIGVVLDALDASGARDKTTVIYTSDHGDNIGARGFWGKSTLWEESAGIPMVVAGPGIAEGRHCTTPVSLIDLHPTVLDIAGAAPLADRTGRSLVELAKTDDPDRVVFAEYHAVASTTGTFMVRAGRYKLIEYVGDDPLLYDMLNDPEETHNLAADPAFADALQHCRNALHNVADPQEINARAFADQAALVDSLGGEDVVRGMIPVSFTAPEKSMVE